MKVIRFPFTAPLQSWGEDARWDTRSTALRPTKSGIIGYLGCCFGFPRGDERLGQLNERLAVAVRVDKPGRIMTDFQTVQGTDGVFLNAEGKPRTGGGTIITPKQYLQDAWFTIYLQGDEDLLEQCFTALMHPRWTPYLGRRNCVPSVPVEPEWVEAETLEDAIAHFTEKDREHSDPYVTVEMDLQAGRDIWPEERVYSRNDDIIHAEKNEYSPRLVKSYVISSGGDTL